MRRYTVLLRAALVGLSGAGRAVADAFPAVLAVASHHHSTHFMIGPEPAVGTGTEAVVVSALTLLRPGTGTAAR